MHNTRMGEGARRQEGTFKNGSATFTYAGREYSLPLDVAGRHSVTPGLYSYENGVRTALLEYGAGDDQYLLLRVPVADGTEARDLVPYLVLNGRIVPPIDVGPCSVNVEQVQRAGAAGQVDCGDCTARRVLEAALHRRIAGTFLAVFVYSHSLLAKGVRSHHPVQDGLALHPRGLRLKAISTLNLRDWHFEQRRRVQACLSVTFQPRMLARERGSISRSCWHWRQVTQMT